MREINTKSKPSKAWIYIDDDNNFCFETETNQCLSWEWFSKEIGIDRIEFSEPGYIHIILTNGEEDGIDLQDSYNKLELDWLLDEYQVEVRK